MYVMYSCTSAGTPSQKSFSGIMSTAKMTVDSGKSNQYANGMQHIPLHTSTTRRIPSDTDRQLLSAANECSVSLARACKASTFGAGT